MNCSVGASRQRDGLEAKFQGLVSPQSTYQLPLHNEVQKDIPEEFDSCQEQRQEWVVALMCVVDRGEE